MATRMNTCHEYERTEDEFVAELNEIYGHVEVCGMTMDAGEVLKVMDPVAFRCGMADMPQQWVCDSCHSIHDSEDEALACCEEWCCDVCGQDYDDEDSAIDCCQHECPSCGLCYESESEADSCCIDEEDDDD